MKTKLLSFAIITMLFTMVLGSCSNNDYNPEDYITSMLSGEYGKGGYKLILTQNGNPVETKGYVRFDSSLLQTGNFRFVDVIPGESKKEFKDVPLTSNDEGVLFTINYEKKGKTIVISGIINFGEMKVNLEI